MRLHVLTGEGTFGLSMIPIFMPKDQLHGAEGASQRLCWKPLQLEDSMDLSKGKNTL